MLTSSLKPYKKLKRQEQLSDLRQLTEADVYSSSADLSSPCLDHEFSGQMSGWLWFQRTNNNALIQRISWDDLCTNNMTYY